MVWGWWNCDCGGGGGGVVWWGSVVGEDWGVDAGDALYMRLAGPGPRSAVATVPQTFPAGRQSAQCRPRGICRGCLSKEERGLERRGGRRREGGKGGRGEGGRGEETALVQMRRHRLSLAALMLARRNKLERE